MYSTGWLSAPSSVDKQDVEKNIDPLSKKMRRIAYVKCNDQCFG